MCTYRRREWWKKERLPPGESALDESVSEELVSASDTTMFTVDEVAVSGELVFGGDADQLCGVATNSVWDIVGGNRG